MKEALKLALEALECALSDGKPYIVKSKEAITAIKEALAQPEQEPVALEKKAGERPYGYRGPLPRPACDCKNWGCWGCCLTEQEIRSRQGIFS